MFNHEWRCKRCKQKFDKNLKMKFHKPHPLCVRWAILSFGREDSETFQSSFPLEDLPINLEK